MKVDIKIANGEGDNIEVTLIGTSPDVIAVLIEGLPDASILTLYEALINELDARKSATNAAGDN